MAEKKIEFGIEDNLLEELGIVLLKIGFRRCKVVEDYFEILQMVNHFLKKLEGGETK